MQITHEPTLRSKDANFGFKGLQDLCAGGLASLTANYFLEKLLVSSALKPCTMEEHHQMLKRNTNAAGSFAHSAHQALLGATQSRPYCRCGTD